MLKNKRLRIARPSTNLEGAKRFYCEGLGMEVLGGFESHNGFDGVMLGHPGQPYHLEFTVDKKEPVKPSPTAEDLLVFYIPDQAEWESVTKHLENAGWESSEPHNPYWGRQGKTFVDFDGYRVVLQNSDWG